MTKPSSDILYKAPLCLQCKHLRESLAGLKCDAFPQGIPNEILTGEHDHRQPYKGDNDITFEPIKEN